MSDSELQQKMKPLTKRIKPCIPYLAKISWNEREFYKVIEFKLEEDTLFVCGASPYETKGERYLCSGKLSDFEIKELYEIRG